MKKRRVILAALFALVGCSGYVQVSGGERTASEVFPDVLKEQTFVYDELKGGEGNLLYTLEFTENGYRLYKDNGTGIVAEGNVSFFTDKSMVFDDQGELLEGSYTGSAFQAPSVTMNYDGRTMTFLPDTESGEYVYLSYLGVYEGLLQKKEAVLILECWKEFYLYVDERLIRGNYEIYEDGTIRFTTLENDVFEGAVEKGTGEIFDIKDVSFSLDVTSEQLSAEDISFVYGTAEVSYEAEHAMGEYTLSRYGDKVFVIHGVDGFVKAMGIMEDAESTTDKDNSNLTGTASYFPREVTNEAELDEDFQIAYTYTEDGVVFPDSTCLLPRSGNIDEETGYGSYWMAGTTLEFVKHAEWDEAAYIQYEVQDVTDKDVPLETAFANESGLLRQAMPSLGTAKPLVLLIEFPDYGRPRFITADAIERAIFDTADRDSLSAYYYRSSYGNLTIDGTVLDWYCMEKERDKYDSDKEIMREVIDYFINEKGLDLAEYDADQDGEVDSLYVLWAGNMGDSDGMWSSAYRSTWENSPEEWKTKINGYIFVPGVTAWSSVPPLVCNVNSLTHETGHLLGLNDYYSYDTSDRKDDEAAYTGGALEGGLGGMDMMDANIAEQNAFSKWLLGWLEPEVVEYEEIAELSGETYTIHPSNEQGEAIFINLKPSDSLFTELLVIEVVNSTMNAKDLTRLKEPAVRILHVDASLDKENLEGNWRSYGFQYDNSYTSTKFISILEADGKDEVLNFIPGLSGDKISYDVEDYFLAGDQVTPNTYPNTNGYDCYGNASIYNGLTIEVESISEDGEAVIRLGYEEQADTLKIIGITPNPVSVPYKTGELVKVPAGTTEIEVTFDREITGEAAELEQIKVLSGNQLQNDFEVCTEGNVLSVGFKEPLESNCDYTLIIPGGIIKSLENKEIINNYNTILGFLTESEQEERDEK